MGDCWDADSWDADSWAADSWVDGGGNGLGLFGDRRRRGIAAILWVLAFAMVTQ